MKPNHAHAAGKGGKENVSQPKPEDEAHRQAAMEELAGYLARGTALLDRCQVMASAKRGNRLGPIFAAARLLNANAQVARVLAQVALVERRSRTIVETVQPSKPTEAELNALWCAEAAEKDDARAKLERRLDELLAAAQAQTAKEEALATPP